MNSDESFDTIIIDPVIIAFSKFVNTQLFWSHIKNH
jgi:hypothetical protein